MGFNIKYNYGPNIEVNDGGRVTLMQGKDGLWHAADAEEAEVVEEVTEVAEEVQATNQSAIEQPHDNGSSLTDSRQAILNQLLDLTDKGEWIKYSTGEQVKAYP